ncbi:MAG: site-2 protease family protein [bacterium]
MLQIRFKKGSCQIAQYQDLPDYLRQVFKPYQDELLELGFILSHCELVDPVFSANGQKIWICAYLKNDEGIYAELKLANIVEPPLLCDISFSSVFADDKFLTTLNYLKHAVVGEIPNTTIQDPYADTLEGHLSKHREYLKQQYPKNPVVITPERYADLSNNALQNYVIKLEKDNYVQNAGDGEYSLKLKPTLTAGLRALGRFFKIQGRKQRALDKLKKQKQPIPRVPVEIEVENFLWYESYSKSRPIKKFIKPALLVLTLVLFLLSFSVSLSMKIVFWIAITIFIHELGHYSGMRLFGYRDTNIFFIPFIGAVTTGMKEDAPVYQKLIIYLLGPVPGMIIGTIMMLVFIIKYSSPEPLFAEAGTAFIAINYFNMLPVLPLDGGQVFNLLLFTRFPLLEVFFYIASAVILSILGFAMQTGFLFIFAVIMLSAVPSKIAAARVIKIIRQRINSEGLNINDEKLLIALIFSLLKDKRPLNFRQKINIVKEIRWRVKSPLPDIKTTFAGIFAYIGFFILPVILIVVSAITYAIFFRPLPKTNRNDTLPSRVILPVTKENFNTFAGKTNEFKK